MEDESDMAAFKKQNKNVTALHESLKDHSNPDTFNNISVSL